MNIATILIALLFTVVVEASFFLSPKLPHDCDRAADKVAEVMAGTKSIELCTDMAVKIGWYCRAADAKGLVGLWRFCVGPDPSTRDDDMKASLEMFIRVEEARRLEAAKPETSSLAVPPIAAPTATGALPPGVVPMQPADLSAQNAGETAEPEALPPAAPTIADPPDDWRKAVPIFGGG